MQSAAVCWRRVLWEVGRQGLAAYVLHLNYPSAYGIIGSFIAVMLWAYYASLVILIGAEYVRVLGEEASAHGSRRRKIEPSRRTRRYTGRNGFGY